MKAGVAARLTGYLLAALQSKVGVQLHKSMPALRPWAQKLGVPLQTES
jgi:hypothetical protein